jgi:hypothetical protein
VFVEKGDYESLFEKVAQDTSLFAILAHPSSSDYDSTLLKDVDSIRNEAIVGISYRSGPAFSEDTLYDNPSSTSYNARFKDLLKRGYHAAPTIDHDNHYITFGRTTPGRTVVLADTLTQESILNALRASRFYASDDWNAEVSFTCNSHYMGETVTELTDPSFTVSVSDPDAGDDIDYIRLRYGVPGSGSNSTILTSSSTSSLSYTHSISQGDTFYYYLEIRQNDDDRIVTAPIRFIKENASVLPIQIVDFNAESDQNGVLLSWELGNSDPFFQLDLARSIDAMNWQQLVSIPGDKRNWLDTDPDWGTNYYRLRVYAPGGVLLDEYETHVRLNQPLFQTVHVYPNPSNSEIMIVYTTNTEETIQARFVDLLGKEVLRLDFGARRGSNNYKISDLGIERGLFLLKIDHASGTLVTSLSRF